MLETEIKIEIVHTTNDIVIEAGKISQTFGIPLIDSLIASTSIITNCDTIISKDRHFLTFCKRKGIKQLKW